MASGTARRAPIAGVPDLAALIDSLESDQAIVLGALRPGLPDEVKVVTKAKLKDGVNDVIARTADDLVYREGQPAFALLDTDAKGMPDAVAAKVEQAGGIWQALLSVLPELEGVARVERRSTGSGLSRSDTGEPLPGSGNLHVYIAVKDGADIERFLRTFHERCWLAGLGWLMVSKSGALLERSAVDRMVFGPERLVFEGAPILIKPVQQDQESRRPVAVAGTSLDTSALFPPLTIVETAKYRELQAKEEHRLADKVEEVRSAYVDAKAKELVACKPNMTLAAALQVIEHQCEGILLPDVVLPFDDDELEGCTVGDVLADPDRFVGAVLADPNEGVEYGRGKAMILRRSDGTLFINSFAHGRTVYYLKLDAVAVRAEIEQCEEKAAVKTLVELAIMADLDAQELEELRELAHERSKINKRTIDSMLKAARQEHAAKRAKQEHTRHAAERTDPRQQIPNPDPNMPWLPYMQVLNDVLGPSPDLRPSMRDIDNDIMRVKKLRVPDTHAFTAEDANAEAQENSND
jgi:hypothetical protein